MGAAGGRTPGLGLFRARSRVEKPSAPLNGLGGQEKRHSVISSNSGVQRSKTVLVQDGAISKKDVEVDWRDRLKNWKRRGMTAGAVTGFDDQVKLQNASVPFSVLGCL